MGSSAVLRTGPSKGFTGRGPFSRVKMRSRDQESKSRETKPAILIATASDDAAAQIDETVRRAQQGDAAAFETLYHLHCRRVYALCLRMTGDISEAEDLAQDAFLQLFRKIRTFRGESAFSSWLHRLTANVVLMHFRRKKQRALSLDEILACDEETGRVRPELGVQDQRLAGTCDRINLDAAIGELPEGYKRMLLLHDVQGYQHNEIAGILGCSIGNSKSQLHKARKRLRELLSINQLPMTYPSVPVTIPPKTSAA